MSAPRTFKKDGADKRIYVTLYDSSTFLPKTGLIHSDMTGSYARDGGNRTAITMATLAATDSVHSDGGFKEMDSTNMPGVYRFDLPDAVIASGVNEVTVTLKASGVVTDSTTIYLTAYDPYGIGVDSATVADAVWDEARSGHVTAGTFGEYVNANTTLVSGDSVAADNLEAMLDGTGATLTAVLGADAITANSIASNAITAAKVATDAIGAAQIAAGAIASDAFAAGAITSSAFAAGAVDANALAADAANEIADALLNRNVAGGSSTGRTVKQALYFLRNKFTKTGGTVTVYQTDDATPEWTAAYTTAAEDAVDSVDPA